MDITELQRKIDYLNELVNDYEKHLLVVPVSTIWQTKAEVIELFKITDFTNKEQRQQFWNDFKTISDALAVKQQKQLEDNQRFAEEAEAIVTHLELYSREKLDNDQPSRELFTELRALFERSFEHLKQNRWPSKEKRTAIWDRFTELRSAFKEKEQTFYTALKEAQIERETQSQALLIAIEPILDTALPETPVADTIRASQNLAEMVEVGKNNWLWLQQLPADPDRQSLKIKSDAVASVRQQMIVWREQLTREHRQLLFDKLDGIRDIINEAWQAHRANQKKRQDEWEQRKKEFAEKRTEWEIKQRNFLTMLENRLRHKQAFFKKISDQPSENQFQIERLESRIASQQDFLIKLQAQLLDLEEQHASAWSKGFKERSLGWIAEKQARVTAIEKDILDMHKRVASLTRMNAEKPPIRETIEAEIQELEVKIAEVKANLSQTNAEKLPNESQSS